MKNEKHVLLQKNLCLHYSHSAKSCISNWVNIVFSISTLPMAHILATDFNSTKQKMLNWQSTHICSTSLHLGLVNALLDSTYPLSRLALLGMSIIWPSPDNFKKNLLLNLSLCGSIKAQHNFYRIFCGSLYIFLLMILILFILLSTKLVKNKTCVSSQKNICLHYPLLDKSCISNGVNDVMHILTLPMMHLFSNCSTSRLD